MQITKLGCNKPFAIRPAATLFKLRQTELYTIYKQTFFWWFYFYIYIFFCIFSPQNLLTRSKENYTQSTTRLRLYCCSQKEKQMHNEENQTVYIQKPTSTVNRKTVNALHNYEWLQQNNDVSPHPHDHRHPSHTPDTSSPRWLPVSVNVLEALRRSPGTWTREPVKLTESHTHNLTSNTVDVYFIDIITVILPQRDYVFIGISFVSWQDYARTIQLIFTKNGKKEAHWPWEK